MSTDSKEHQKLNEMSEQQIQILKDEQTVFSLAVLMMEIHTGTLIKNKNIVAHAFMKAGIVLRNNGGFPERFKKVIENLTTQMKQEGPPIKGSTPLPTDTALGIVPTMEAVPPVDTL